MQRSKVVKHVEEKGTNRLRRREATECNDTIPICLL